MTMTLEQALKASDYSEASLEYDGYLAVVSTNEEPVIVENVAMPLHLSIHIYGMPAHFEENYQDAQTVLDYNPQFPDNQDWQAVGEADA